MIARQIFRITSNLRLLYTKSTALRVTAIGRQSGSAIHGHQLGQLVTQHQPQHYLIKQHSTAAVIACTRPIEVLKDKGQTTLSSEQLSQHNGNKSMHTLSMAESCLIRFIRYPLLLASAWTGCLAGIMLPYHNLFNAYELGEVAIPLVMLPYMVRQHYLWCRQKTMKLDYNASTSTYTIKTMGLLRSKTTSFQSDELVAKCCADMPKVTSESPSPLQQVTQLYRQPVNPNAYVIKSKTDGKEGMQFVIDAQSFDGHPGAEAFCCKRSERGCADSCTNHRPKIQPLSND